MAKSSAPKWPQHVGLVGLDEIGEALVKRLKNAKYALSIYDASPKRMQAWTDGPGLTRRTPKLLATASDVILVNLNGTEETAQMIAGELLPTLSAETIVINLGAIDVFEARRLGQVFSDRKMRLLDAPVSGTAADAEAGSLSCYVGGEKSLYEKCLPLLHAFTAAGQTPLCGLVGSGQIIRAAEKVAVLLSRAAILEAVALGTSFGMSRTELIEILQHSEAARQTFKTVTKKLNFRGGESVSIEYPTLLELIEVAKQQKQDLPLTQALQNFLKDQPKTVIENGRSVPSYWNALKKT